MKELAYLRHEIQQRSVFFHEQYHKILWNVMMVWGGTALLFSSLTKDGATNINTMQIMDIHVTIFYVFMVITIFFISVVVLYLSALKDSRNQRDICRTSAYKIVFYDENPRPYVKNYEADGTDEKDEKNYWDLFLFEMMREKMGGKSSRNSKKIHKPVIFKPEIILSILAISMEIFFLIMIFANYRAGISGIGFSNLFMVIICCLLVVISLCLLFAISQTSVSKEQRFEMIKGDLKSFIKHAIKIKYYTEEQVKEKYGEDFWTEVMGLPVKEETEQDGK